MQLQRALSFAQFLLVGLFILAHGLLLVFAFNVRPQSVVTAYLVETSSLGQVALLLAWGILACRRWVWRFAFLVDSLLIGAASSMNTDGLAAMQVAHLATLVPLLIGIRLLGFSITKSAPGEQRPMLQFSISGLLILTGVAAFFITGMGLVRHLFFSEQEAPFGLSWAGVLFALVSMCVIFLMMRLRNLLSAVVGSLIAATAVGLVLAYISRHESDSMIFMGWTLTHAGIIILSFMVIRLCGFRMVRPPRELPKLAKEAKSQPNAVLSPMLKSK